MSSALTVIRGFTVSDTLITNGEPDTRRRVSPVPREGVGNLLFIIKSKAPFPYPTIFLPAGKLKISLRTVILS